MDDTVMEKRVALDSAMRALSCFRDTSPAAFQAVQTLLDNITRPEDFHTSWKEAVRIIAQACSNTPDALQDFALRAADLKQRHDDLQQAASNAHDGIMATQMHEEMNVIPSPAPCRRHSVPGVMQDDDIMATQQSEEMNMVPPPTTPRTSTSRGRQNDVADHALLDLLLSVAQWYE